MSLGLNHEDSTMNASRMRVGVAVILYAAVLGSPLAWTQGPTPAKHPETKERARVALSHALPKLNGEHLKATVVEVHYGPGESSPPHSHPCAVIGYVVEGALRTQVKGETEAIYKAGESFYEAPNSAHLVSANASQTEAATFIAYFVCDHDTPLSSDVPEIATTGGE
jgi:quercetin dioxygenase-like cupin family protein